MLTVARSTMGIRSELRYSAIVKTLLGGINIIMKYLLNTKKIEFLIALEKK
jgi:hypothetical protein